MKYKAYWKTEPEIEIEKIEDLEQAEEDMLINISMNISDFIAFEEDK